MPIHFSIGFVAEGRPKIPFESVCAVANDVSLVGASLCREQAVVAVAENVQRLRVTWPRELGECQ